MSRIFTVQLRTTDVELAKVFYAAVLEGDQPVIFELHEQARARGARPHWLGFIDVPNLDRALGAVIGLGASRLGPTFRSADGHETAVIRDPGGAVVALAEAPAGVSSYGPEVVWYQLNAAQVPRTKGCYRDVFGWRCDEPVPVPSAGVVNHPFAWQAEAATVGAMADIADRPGVHPHWLYHFPVEGLDRALDRVTARGGQALPPIELDSGARIAVCDDAQGAAFALLERP